GAAVAALGGRRAAIVTDATVGALYAARLRTSLERSGLQAGVVTVAPGEASKSYAGYAEVCDGLLALKVERGDLVVALGGGVV
ncbi:3-dehydroquinate synthase, partial [Escherichia coli]|nr:3-dehydroquinate synthase [Escherichia coli]